MLTTLVAGAITGAFALAGVGLKWWLGRKPSDPGAQAVAVQQKIAQDAVDTPSDAETIAKLRKGDA